ncbi:hypothetical protein [Enterovirga rhinocerotis]|uniref:Uncharacterized protein n=1 Tax=Enterovirga rhinocerotis TaxID=1339210 RepID=A0A4R7BTQ7_9HYPH|nr:hypothetical protein [Enterovirga rhinocerotis]TDR89110.1 hypothetical protein EV668_3598 [Enterovirga rhinocerotis]
MDFAVVIRLKASGRMARFDEYGRLVEWTGDVLRATHFRDLDAAELAIYGICAPELRAAIRAGYAAVVEVEDTGETYIVDAHDHYELYPRPRIRPDLGPRFIDDDARQGVPCGDRAGREHFAAALVSELFREAPLKNWRLQTLPRISPARIPGDEYTTPISARARHAGALARFQRTSRVPAHAAA